MNRDLERWGEQTDKAIANFQISGEPMPARLIQALALVKAAAATVNAASGVISVNLAGAITRAAEEIVNDEMRDQFPVDVFQTGSGTSTNMNVNEVIADRATEILGQPVHPNDHVNASQSSNDVVPTALRIAAARAIIDDLIPVLVALGGELRTLAQRHEITVKAGRTHLMDAVPMTFGQEVGGWARAAELSVQRLQGVRERLCELPIGGTAVGTGLNAPRGFGRLVAAEISHRTHIDFTEAHDHFEAQSAHDAVVETSGALRSVALSLHKIAGDLRLLGSGPANGLGEIQLAELQAGSSIMPGKVNPVIPEVVQQVAAQVVGNDAAIVFASTMSTLQLNTALPVMARNLLSSIDLLSAVAAPLRQCVRDITVNVAQMASYAESTPALMTALAPELGYDAAADIVHRAEAAGVSVRQLLTTEQPGLDPELLARLDPLALARPDQHKLRPPVRSAAPEV